MVTLEYVKDYHKIAKNSVISRVDNSYRDLYSNSKGFIMSSVVQPVKVNDPVVQKMIDDISVVLRGVDDKYFPVIKYVNAERREEQYILLFAAEGKDFRLGVICGTDGSISGFQFMNKKLGFTTKVHTISDPDILRQSLDRLGDAINRRRRK